jgi:hypothetical protein
MIEMPTLVTSPCPQERPWSAAHVHAPDSDESFVAVPDVALAVAIAHRNRDLLGTARADIQGKDLAVVRRWARRSVLAAANDYTTRLLADEIREGKVSETPAAALSEGAMVFVGGHQPTLFHPGVWVKNFVVGALAKRDAAVGLNLVVDTDNLSGTALRVPTGPREAPAVTMTTFDEPRPRQPWEEARIIDRHMFDTFPDRVASNMGNWGFAPLLPDFWPAAVRHSAGSDGLAECLTAARCAWERRWGNNNLELPVSRLCTLEPFLWFAAHLLAHLPRFHAVYNEVLHEYRQVNRVRSRTHPVPDLRRLDGWLEAPFRVWRAGDEVRRRVYARQDGVELRLSDGESVFAKLPLAPGREACCAVRELQQLESQGIRFRTRALTTTLFARLCIADLFVHGLGGSKYDQMTDRIVARFFGLPAPEFVTISATVLLPVPPLPVAAEDEHRLRRQLRELEYNSDRHLSGQAFAASRGLVAEKQALIAQQADARRGPPTSAGARGSGSGYARFRRLQEIRRLLADATRADRRCIEDELTRTRQQLAANGILLDREYAFCLYPADKLKRFMDHVTTFTNG